LSRRDRKTEKRDRAELAFPAKNEIASDLQLQWRRYVLG
jgi:hypothetical protein